MTIIDKKIEYVPGSQVSIQAKISKKDMREMYDKMLLKYQAKLNLPGFRKGKAPVKMIERRFGEALKGELVADVLEEAIRQVSPELERKPLHYAQPNFDGGLDADPDKDFSFTLRLDVEPEFKVADYKKMSTTVYTVKVSDKDVDEEIKRIQERNALVVTKNGAAAEGDIVTADYAELDEDGKPVDGTKREGFVFTLGQDATYYDFDKDVTGMSAGEEKVIEKKFAKTYRHEELAGKKVKLKVKVTAVKQRNLPDLDDEFAQDVDEKFKTLADLKKDIKEKLENNAIESARNHRINTLMKEIIDSTEIDMPESMLMMEADMRLRQMAQQSGMDQKTLMKMLGGHEKELIEQWRPDLIESAKSRLVLNKLKDELNVSVDEKDKEEAKKYLIGYYRMEEEQLIKQVGPEMWQRYVEEEAKERKLHQTVLDAAKVKEEKTLSWQEFVAESSASAETESKPKAKSKAKSKAKASDGEKAE